MRCSIKGGLGFDLVKRNENLDTLLRCDFA